jgi:hypothetical protein
MTLNGKVGTADKEDVMAVNENTVDCAQVMSWGDPAVGVPLRPA